MAPGTPNKTLRTLPVAAHEFYAVLTVSHSTATSSDVGPAPLFVGGRYTRNTPRRCVVSTALK